MCNLFNSLTNIDIVELEKLIKGEKIEGIISTDTSIEDVIEFALEKHLEEFLVKNWKNNKRKNIIYEQNDN